MPKFYFHGKHNSKGWLWSRKCFFPQNCLFDTVNLLLWIDVAVDCVGLFSLISWWRQKITHSHVTLWTKEFTKLQVYGAQKNAPGKKAPRKKPPRKLPPEDMPPRKIVPWKIAPRKNAPRTIAPWVIVLLDFRCFWHYLRVVYFKTFCSFRGVTRTPATSIIDLLVTVANSIN